MMSNVAKPAFGSVLTDTMAVAEYRDGRWQAHALQPVAPIPMHPAAHVLHYDLASGRLASSAWRCCSGVASKTSPGPNTGFMNGYAAA